MAHIYVDIKDHLDELDTDDLLKELKRRGREDVEFVPIFESNTKLLKYLRALLDIRPTDDNNRIIEEIKNLF